MTTGSANNATTRTPERGRGLLPGILAASLLLSVLFALRVPFDGSNPDETAHLDYVRLLAERRQFVTYQAGDPALAEAHQPPLYYLLCVPAYLATGGSLFAVRLVAALLQLATVYVAYRAGRDLFPSRPEVAPGLAAFVAFLPTQAQLAASVNNDGLTTFFCAVLFWKAARTIEKGYRRGPALLAALAFGLGMLTKLSVLQIVPALAVAMYLAVRGGRMKTADAVRWLAVVVGLGLMIAAPWLIRNTLLYGDPLTAKLFKSFEATTATAPGVMQAMRWSLGDYARINALRTYATFWHILPPNILAPDLSRFALTVLLGLGGLVGAFRGPEWGGVAGSERRVVLLSLLTLLLLVPFFVRFNLQFFQAQGRYFLPALLPVGILAAVGWGNVAGERRRGAAVAVLTVVLALLALYQVGQY